MEDKYLKLEDLVRNRYASVAWTHKIQEKQAEIYLRKYAVLAVINIIAASITSAGICSLIFTDQSWVKIVSALVSFVTVFITALLKAFDLQSMAKANKATATKLVVLRDEFQTLLLKIRQCDQTVAELMEDFERLQKEVHAVYQEAPATSNAAVKKAGIALAIKKDSTFSDNEIDALLPDSLKRGVQK